MLSYGRRTGYVSENRPEPDGQKQSGLVFLLDSQVDQDSSDGKHDCDTPVVNYELQAIHLPSTA